jgi:hypothetical protein
LGRRKFSTDNKGHLCISLYCIGGTLWNTGNLCQTEVAISLESLKVDVENFDRQCATCQQAKHERIHPARLLQPLPVPHGAWQDISMDFIESLSKSKGANSLLVIVDKFMK